MLRYKDILVNQIQTFCDSVGVHKVLFGEKTPEVPHPRDLVISPRILFPISGVMEIIYTSDQQVHAGRLNPGEVLFLPELCCTRSIWTCKYELISIVLRKEWLRVLYMDIKGDHTNSRTTPIPDAFYHIEEYHAAIPNVFTTIALLTKERDSQFAVRQVQCLIDLTIRDLKLSHHLQTKLPVQCSVWPQIIEYIHDHISDRQLSRDGIAKHFCLSPQYISRLFKKNTGITLTGYITAERIKHAEDLLHTTNLTVKEIGWECGYNYPSYFIRQFQKYKKVSPREFRLHLYKDKIDSRPQ